MAIKKRARDAARSKAAILNAAERVFSKKGFAGSSMSDIAKAARVPQSLLHHHFGTKLGLWRAVFARFAEGYAAHQGAVADPKAVQPGTLLRALQNDFHYWRAHPNLLRLQAWAQLEGGDLFGKQRDAMYRPFLAVAAAAREKGYVRADIDPANLVTIGAAAVTYWLQYADEVQKSAGRKVARETADAGFLRNLETILDRGAWGTR